MRHHPLIALLAAGAALALPGTALAADTFHVSPDGSDDAAGTSPDTAWRTLARASAADLEPGDRVLLRGGARFAGVLHLDAADRGTALAPVVIGSYGGGRATIAGGTGTAVFAQDTGGLTLRDLVLEGAGATVNRADGLTVYTELPGAQRLPAVRVERVEAHGFGRWGMTVGSWAGRTGFDVVNFDDVRVHHNGRGGLTTYAEQRAVHRKVTVRRTHAWSNLGVPGLEVNTGNGIVLGGVDGGRIERSVAHHNGGLNDAAEGGAGIWTYDSNRMVIEFNESYANRTGGRTDGDGFDLDDRVSNSVVRFNYSHDNDGAGFLVANPSADPVHRGNVIRFNVSHGDARRNGYGAIEVWQRALDLEVDHNTVVSAGAAVRLHMQWAPPAGVQGVRLRNNVLVGAPGHPIVHAARDGRAGVRLEGNAYWAGSREAFSVLWGDRRHASLAAFRNATGQERLPDRATGIDADPRIAPPAVALTLRDVQRPTAQGPLAVFAPAAGSPLVDGGLDLRARFGLDAGPRDLLGRATPAGARPDVGAIEAALAR